MKRPCWLPVVLLTLALPAIAAAQQPIVAGGFQVLGRPPGKVETQDMSPFPLGKWQNDDQLWWTGAEPGDKLNLVLPIKDEGAYRLNVVLTKAVDYAIVQFYLDGQKAGTPIDLFNPRVIVTRPLPLGTHRLTAGNHKLTIAIVGANPDAVKGYMVGLDYLLLKRTDVAQAEAFTYPAATVAAAALYPHVSLPPEEAAKAMRLPPGFSVRLGAGEPDVRQPIAMALDDRGRVWIAEAYEYPRRAKGDKGRDRILIFEDTQGTGKLDKRTVFYEGLNLVSGLEVGFGGVWVGAAPYLLYIPIKAGEDRPAGPPQVLLDGWGYHDTHEMLNTFIWGPDGWLYGCHGVFTHSNVGKPGTPNDKRIPINAGIWRYHPTRHVFEVFAEGTSNPWGIDFNDQGQAFCTACVIPHLFHVIQGARYQRQAGQHFNPHTYADIQTIADHLHYVGNQWNNNDRRRSDDLGGGHAHAGAMIYLGGSWPEKYRGQIFMNNIHGNRINMDTLRPRGSGYVGSHGADFILTDDQSSQILNLRYGPDGSAWMIDWYDRNQCHNPDPAAHDRSNGRIFQVRYGDVKPVHVNLQQESDEALVRMQLSANDWYVRHARRVLQERAAAGKLQAAASERLALSAMYNRDETRRLRALWALHVTNGLSLQLANELLKNDRPHVRAWTIQLLVEDKNQPLVESTLKRFAEMARNDPSPVVRLYLAAALQRLPLASRWDILEGLVSHPEDGTDHNLPLMYWYAAEPLAGADQRRALALAMVAGENIPLLRDFMVRRIGSATTARALELLVEGLGQSKQAAQQVAFLRGMNRALVGVRKIDAPEAWDEVYARLLKDGTAEVRSHARALAVTFGDGEALAAMRRQCADVTVSVPDRKKALASLQGAGAPDLAVLLQKLTTDPALRAEALRGLAAFDDPNTPKIVLGLYPSLPPAEKRDALTTLCARAPYAETLLAAVEKNQIRASDLTADLVRQLRNLHSAKLDERIRQVWGSVRDSDADRVKLIARYKTMLTAAPKRPPDASLGRAMFAKTCQQCHTLYGVGGKVGPDITGSNRADLDYLLSNVLDPSAVIAKEYQASIVATTSGRVLTGIVRDNGKNALTLQTANETVVLPRSDIEDVKLSPKSMMPDDLLQSLTEHEVRSLVTYLGGRGQTPMRATLENVAAFWDGKDLAGWGGDPKLWSVENGAIVCRAPAGSALVSEMLVEDFHLTLEVKLDGEHAAGAIAVGCRLGSDRQPKAEMRAGFGRGQWGKLLDVAGSKDGEAHVKDGEWNRYEVIVKGGRIVTRLNGRECTTADLPADYQPGVIALEVGSGPPQSCSFRNLRLQLLSPDPKGR